MPLKPRQPPPRETSKLALLSLRAVALGNCALCTGAVALGTYPEALAEGGANVVLPLGAAAVLGIGLGTAWHFILGIASHAEKGETHKKALAACLGAVLCGVGFGTSAWFLASKIGGASAVQSVRLEHVRKLSDGLNVAALNAGSEQGLIASLDGGASALKSSAAREAKGTGASGRVGEKAVYESLMILAESISDTANAMRDGKKRRDDLLASGERNIAEAAKAATAGSDGTAFQQAATRAGRAIADADNIHLRDYAGNIGGGVVVAAKARPIVDDVISRMKQALDRAEDSRRPLALPVFVPVTAKEAVILNPPPLAWIAAGVIEFLPLIGLSILLLLWREHDDDDRRGGGEAPAPVVIPPAPRPRPTLWQEPAE
jgi:hypothetical protein